MGMGLTITIRVKIKVVEGYNMIAAPSNQLLGGYLIEKV